jgi:hypothetical protein
MLDATERKTLAWCTFIAGVLCVIPGETPRGPRVWDYLRQVLVDRLLEHRSTQIAWAISAALVIHHLWRTRKEEAANAKAPTSPEAPASVGS